MRWGFYADGFFDRRAHNNPYVGPGVNGYDVREGNTAVAWGTKDIAYIGTLFFNPSTNSPRRNASIFVPGAGYKYSFDGELIESWTVRGPINGLGSRHREYVVSDRYG